MERRDEISGVDLDAVRRVLDAAPVSVGVLYGSGARGDAHSRSDIDIGVAFEDVHSPSDRTRERLSLIDALSAALGTDDIDVVPITDSPPELRRSIRRDGVVVYGSLDRARDLLATPDSEADDAPLDSFDDILGDLRRVV
ncbi:type VII toxin-antitoxin system MntA family adenylyltransferase antitoxin [Halosimplex halophilum]|uniref:type VII toxin-antitoxin system MntA family adenylyltransferase antitoxin n=1 Tax=Halosimplex halophilum TaxID=2559572 RepID=UPI0014354931|nr:nucleotidyltransferase domain-containing protein [Halosimplex halophilum]